MGTTEVVTECEALADADKARAAAAKQQQEQGQEANKGSPRPSASEVPTQDLGAFRCVASRAHLDCRWI